MNIKTLEVVKKCRRWHVVFIKSPKGKISLCLTDWETLWNIEFIVNENCYSIKKPFSSLDKRIETFFKGNGEILWLKRQHYFLEDALKDVGLDSRKRKFYTDALKAVDDRLKNLEYIHN